MSGFPLEPGWDVIVDGADNFPTRYLVNDASVWHDIPVVYGSIFRFDGQVTVFKPGTGPCYAACSRARRLPNIAPSCAEGGVLGVLPGVIGSIQATEALKPALGIGEPLVGRLLLYDAPGDAPRRRSSCGATPPARSAATADDHRVRRLRRVLLRWTFDHVASATLRGETAGEREVEAGARAAPSASCSTT